MKYIKSFELIERAGGLVGSKPHDTYHPLPGHRGRTSDPIQDLKSRILTLRENTSGDYRKDIDDILSMMR